jgi:hypothetical protein
MDDTTGRIEIHVTRPHGSAENDIPNEPAPVRTLENTRGFAVGGSGDDVEERTKQIRDQIENTRGEMTETIDAIQEKLKPGNIVANATERVKSATTEGVREVSDTVSQTARLAFDYTRDTANSVVDTARQNPIPLALLGIGAAWWLASRSRNSSSPSSERSGRRSRDGRNQEDGYGGGSRSPEGPGTERPDVTVTGDSPMARATSRAREYTSNATESIQRIARQRKNQLQRTMEQNPLLVGASALILGAAFGLAVPETDTENEWMGTTRDAVVNRARDMARGAANKVQEAASSVAEEAINLTEKPQP